jgi:hypothetical protein
MVSGVVMQGFAGFLAGVVAGAAMGIASDVAARFRFFRSSMFIVDGNFLLKTFGIKDDPMIVYAAGIPMHLVTSGIFGAIYPVAARFAGLETFSFALAALYVVLLWLSMLFIALPTAGQGLLGKKAGPLTWLEQLALHVVFLVVYYGMLRIIGGPAAAIAQAIR